MNIFVLDRNPIQAARYHNDKHCIKMILEHTQMLSTAIRVCSHDQVDGVYKIAHLNHPWSDKQDQTFFGCAMPQRSCFENTQNDMEKIINHMKHMLSVETMPILFQLEN
jgi:hypothetical protein